MFRRTIEVSAPCPDTGTVGTGPESPEVWVVRRNKPSSGEFARLWAALSASQQHELIGQVRAALHEVPRADITTHPPVGTAARPMQHAHPHHFSGDSTHSHLHEHAGDALHIGHDHSDIEHAMTSAEHAKQSRARAPIMNTIRPVSPMRQARIDRAWSNLAAGIPKGYR